jgi:hypothetical protein
LPLFPPPPGQQKKEVVKDAVEEVEKGDKNGVEKKDDKRKIEGNGVENGEVYEQLNYRDQQSQSNQGSNGQLGNSMDDFQDKKLDRILGCNQSERYYPLLRWEMIAGVMHVFEVNTESSGSDVMKVESQRESMTKIQTERGTEEQGTAVEVAQCEITSALSTSTPTPTTPLPPTPPTSTPPLPVRVTPPAALNLSLSTSIRSYRLMNS